MKSEQRELLMSFLEVKGRLDEIKQDVINNLRQIIVEENISYCKLRLLCGFKTGKFEHLEDGKFSDDSIVQLAEVLLKNNNDIVKRKSKRIK